MAALTAAIAFIAPILVARGETIGSVDVTTIATGFDRPWAVAFLPDGRMLVTEKPGRLRLVSREGQIGTAIRGVPEVWNAGQGGLHDVALDRNFATNRTLYLCFAERAAGGGRTSVARATLSSDATALDDVTTIFRQDGPLSSGNHFGCRIAQAGDRNLFIGLGDHYSARNDAQNLANHIGKIVRIAPDGGIPSDNPFVGRDGAKSEIWSIGHRNIQALAIEPATGALWEVEHGPRGGDEINIAQRGKNYGWPVIGYGIDYSGAIIHEATAKAGMEQPVKYWVPSIAPSGMAFATSDRVPMWKGSLFVGALAGQALVRLTRDGDRITGEERLLTSLNARIRDVRQGPDGAIWVLTDAGRLLRVTPKA